MTESVHEGGCLCGALRYRATGAPGGVAWCHCAMCRKASGAPAVAWATFAPAAVTFLRGEPRHYRSSAIATRGFCARCGSPLTFRYGEGPDELDLAVGTLDDPARLPPTHHIFWADRVPWLSPDDDLPRHAAFSTGARAPVAGPAPAGEPPPAGAHEGGCLCGAVRYRVQGTPLAVEYCHCSMCRRATGGPVAVWADVPLHAFRLLAGAPAAYASSPEHTRGFCARCGGQLTFRRRTEPPWISLTVATLDDPAVFPPARHIYDADRVPWLALRDGLPRHAERPPAGPAPA